MNPLATAAGPAIPFEPAKEEPLYEVIDGQNVALPPMGIYANIIAVRILQQLLACVEANRLGKVTIDSLFILDSARDLRRRPDVAIVSASAWPLDRPLSITGSVRTSTNTGMSHAVCHFFGEQRLAPAAGKTGAPS
jgi:Uma2 family endonuclease